MEDYIAIVGNANNKITKYQDFAKEADANAHVCSTWRVSFVPSLTEV